MTEKKPTGPTCTVVDGCTGTAVLQATRSCSSCGEESMNLRDNAEQRRSALAEQERREEQIKDAARARDGACGCGDPSSHDGSPPEKPKKARKPADYVSVPQPCPRPQSSDLTELEKVTLHMIAEQRRELGTQIEQLEAAAGRVAKEHTHPVFACDKHVKRLPK